MDEKELRVYNETKLRNLQRKYSKLKEHPELTEEAIDVKSKIDAIKMELQYD